MQYADPAEPVIYYDEAEIEREEVEREFADASTRRAEAEAALLEELVDEALQVPQKDRLSVAWPTGRLLDAEASKCVGAQLAQERAEGEALRRAGLLPTEETT